MANVARKGRFFSLFLVNLNKSNLCLLIDGDRLLWTD